MAVAAHPHPRVRTLLFGLFTSTIQPKNDLRIDNDFNGMLDTPSRKKITINANCHLLQTCKDARNMALVVYSRYVEVCTCDGRHYPRYLETVRRHLSFRSGSTKRKKWRVKDCQRRTYFASDQMLYLPDLHFYAPGSLARDVAIEHLALQISAFEYWDPAKIITLLKRFKSLKSLTLICSPGFWNRWVSDLVGTPHGCRSLKETAEDKHESDWEVLNTWIYEYPGNWWNNVPGIKMNIMYIHHDSLGMHMGWSHEGDSKAPEDEQKIPLGNLGPKINGHIKDMETWTEELYIE